MDNYNWTFLSRVGEEPWNVLSPFIQRYYGEIVAGAIEAWLVVMG